MGWKWWGMREPAVVLGPCSTQIHISSISGESLASVRGFLNHGWRIQVPNLRLIKQVLQQKSDKLNILCDMTFCGAHRLERQSKKRELMKMCNRSSTLLLQLAITPANHEPHKSHLPHRAISGPSHINIVWHQKTKEDAAPSFHNWFTDTWLFTGTLSGGSTLNAQPLTRQQVTNLMCVAVNFLLKATSSSVLSGFILWS